jgi:hypothetical protein
MLTQTKRLVMILTAMGSLTGSLLAQSMTQGAIAGTVFDTTNAVIPRATVLIHNDATAADLTLTTGDAGEFRAPQLAPGTYTVTITAAAFSKQQQNGVIVQVNGVTEVNPHLSTGSTASTVEVTADSPVLKFESAEYGGHLDSKEIESIPINNRRWSALALTTPAVTNSSDGFGLLSFRAISPLLNVIEIDGADDNQAFFAEERGRTRAGYSTSQAAVREFTVNTGVYGADFGRAVGGVVNTVTKSGGNQLHGELYFYNRNSSRSAFVPGASNTTFNTATQQYVTAPYRPKDNRNQLGFGVGGPLIKNKLFWFYAFDEFRRNFPGTAKAANPGLFFVSANAALSGSETCSATGVFTGTPSGSTSPNITAATQASYDAAACTLAGRLASGSYARGAATYNTQLQAFLPNLGSVPRYGNQNINTPKIDYQLNSKNHVSFLYHRLRWDSPGGVQTQGTNPYAIDTFGTDFVKLDYGVAKLDTLITNSISNEIRYQYGRELNNEGNQTPSAYTTQNLFNNTGSAPQVSLTSATGFQLGQPYYGFRKAYPDERKWQIGDTASVQWRKHNIRFGEDIVHNNDYQDFLNTGNGQYNYTTAGPAGIANYFSDLVSKGKTCTGAGTGVAPLGGTVAGIPCYNTFQQGTGQSVFEIKTTDYGFFVQDDWKITPRLTLNLGARYDYESFPAPIANLVNPALPQTGNRPSDKNNIAPRLGFAYDPFGLSKTVVRGGFGFYYGRVPNNYILQTYSGTGLASAFSLASVLPTVANAPTLPNVLTTVPTGTASAQFFAPNFQNPYAEQFDLAVQQNLGYSTVLSISYIGALGRELPNYINVNLDPTKTYTQTYTVAPAAGTTNCGPTACGTYNVQTYAGRQCTTAACTSTTNILKNPAFSAITESFSNINSAYHGLTVDVTNRSNKWVSYDVNYTWSHAQDFSQNAATAPSTNNWLDPFGNQRLNYGNSNQNVPHRVVGWAILNAPGLRGHGLLTYATNGWSLKPFFQMQSGLPFSALTTGTAANQSVNCPVVGGVTQCLVAASSGIAGTGATGYLPFIGRNTFSYPRTIQIDLRAQKEFTIREHYNLQIFGEAFNLANHQNYTSVSATAYGFSGSTLTYQPGFNSLVTGPTGSATANTNTAYGPRVIQLAARVVF